METRCDLTLEYLSTRLCPGLWREVSEFVEDLGTEETLDGIVGQIDTTS
jgi:hypothetical protein